MAEESVFAEEFSVIGSQNDVCILGTLGKQLRQEAVDVFDAFHLLVVQSSHCWRVKEFKRLTAFHLPIHVAINPVYACNSRE